MEEPCPATTTCRLEGNAKKPNLPPNRPKVKKTQKSSEWRHIHRVDYDKKSAPQKYQFWFLGRMREILEVHR